MKAKQAPDSPRVVDLMNRALKVEYSMVIHHPRIASQLKDEETRKLVLKLGIDSMGHADTVSSVVEGLGESLFGLLSFSLSNSAIRRYFNCNSRQKRRPCSYTGRLLICFH